MSVLEKLQGISEIPIFPLPLVLMPREILPLHIFEPRYRKMLSDIGSRRNLFGICRFEPDSTLSDRPEPGSVGCLAEVRRAERLPDGRSNILTLGVCRFRIREYVRPDEAYLAATVDFFSDRAEDPAELDPLADEVLGLFARLARAAEAASGEIGGVPELPRSDPESMSFYVANSFALDASVKQELIETESTVQRLRRLRGLLVPAIAKAEERALIARHSLSNGHARKKVDLG